MKVKSKTVAIVALHPPGPRNSLISELRRLGVQENVIQVLNSTDKNKWRVFSDSAYHHIKNGWSPMLLAYRFAEVFKAGTNKNNWKVFSDSAYHYIEKGWEMDYLVHGFVEVFKAGANENTLRLFLDTIYLDKEKGREIDDLTQGFAELIRAGADEKQLKALVAAIYHYIKIGLPVNLAGNIAEFIKVGEIIVAGADDFELNIYYNLKKHCHEKGLDNKNSSQAIIKSLKLPTEQRKIAFKILDGITKREKINLLNENVRETIKLLLKDEGYTSSFLILLFHHAKIIDLKPNSEGGLNVVLKSDDGKSLDDSFDPDKEINERLKKLGMDSIDFSEN